LARKILLADDSVTAQNMGRKILVDAGYDVVTVNNGSAALKRINEAKPDLIVLDVYMPGYSGLEVCQRLKEGSDTAHIPVLLTVGKLEPFKPEEARRARADAHIVKPFEASELLSALARLEEGAASAAADPKPRRKAGGNNGSARTDPNDPDTGWKSRLRFPARKKDAKESQTDDAAAGFHDLRRNKGKAAAPAPPPEPELVPDIPRDITPDELDALSAVAARLDARGSGIDSVSTADEPPSATSSVDTGGDVPPASFAVAPQAAAMDSVTAEETPHAEVPQTEISQTEVSQTEVSQIGTVETGTAATNTADSFEGPTVGTAQLAQGPAPIDREDEPMFAAAPAAAGEEFCATNPEATQAPEMTVIAAPATSASADTPTEEAKASELAPESAAMAEALASEEAKVAAYRLEEAKLKTAAEEEKPAEGTLQTASTLDSASAEAQAVLYEAAEAEGPAPSEEELAAALRLLTPATAPLEGCAPSQQELVAAGQLLAEEAARCAAAEPRWVAEAVALTPEEAAISLEAEMFGTALVGSDQEPESTLHRSQDLRQTSIQGSVEESISETNVVSPSEAAATGEELGSPEESTLAPASTLAEESAEMSGSVAPAAEDLQSPSAAMSEEPVQEQMPAATFADVAASHQAASHHAEPVGTEQDISQPTIPTQAAAERTIAEQAIAQAMELAARATAGEAPMTGEHLDAPKTMAAAASAEGASPAPADSTVIASIVDSVLADLRPKIVEEITKKLARK